MSGARAGARGGGASTGVSTSASGSVPTAPSAASLRRIATAEVRKGMGVGAFLLAIVTAGALAHVAVRIKSLEVAYALGRERHVATDLEEQRRRLQIEIGMLKDPGRVVLIARDKLKMGPPAPDAIVALAAAGSLTTAVPVAPSGSPARPGAGSPARSKPPKGTAPPKGIAR
jgi:cell division protein FtsL